MRLAEAGDDVAMELLRAELATLAKHGKPSIVCRTIRYMLVQADWEHYGSEGLPEDLRPSDD